METSRRHLFFVVALCLFLGSIDLSAKQCIDEPTESANSTRLYHDKTRGPRSVSDFINCYYYNSELSFDSYDDIVNFTVSVTDESNGQTAMFYLPDMSETVGISLSAGSYRITLRTFDGQTFEGVLTISE